LRKKTQEHLSRRERQIMDILFRLRRVSVQDVLEALPDPPSYSAVRALMRILEEKGFIRHEKTGAKYVYTPVDPPDSAGKSALDRVVQTFFGGSVEKVVAALLDSHDSGLHEADYERMHEMIEQARKEGS
jgi:BlaI family transcriptional regulator, penicillinase repressor